MPKQVGARQFKDWAGRNFSRWRELDGQTVVHRRFGEGPVTRVYEEAVGIFIVVAYVNEGTRIHSSSYFEKSFKSVLFGEPQAKSISETQAPIDNRRIEALRTSIKNGEILQPRDLLWLGTGDHIPELEEYLKRHGSDWPVAKVAAYWRKSGLPEHNLEVTKGVERNYSSTASTIAPIWTTRGAAYADLAMAKDAERCANKAISCDAKSYYPHNLLGRIFYFLGDVTQGDAHFDIARQLGSDDRWQDDARKQGREGQPIDPDKPDKEGNTDGKSKPDLDDSGFEEVPF